MASSEHVIRVHRSDSDDNFVFLNVSSNGPEPLDLCIQATEGEYPYSTNIKSSCISNLREKKSAQTDSEWENTLLRTLLRHPEESSISDQMSGESIEIVASLSLSRIILVFRKNISGITQRLGEIILDQKNDLELDTLSWTSVAIARGDALESQVAESVAKHASAQETIIGLRQQLEELIATKRAHESALICKFKDLLNAKKTKIRDQERILVGAKVDRQRGQCVENSRRNVNKSAATAVTSASGFEASQPRKGKRKADEAGLADTGDDDSADAEEEAAFEGPFSNATATINDTYEEVDEMARTPDATDDDATEDEDEDERKIEDPNKSFDAPGSRRMQTDTSPSSGRDLPPDRELPFEKGAAAAKNQDETMRKPQQQHNNIEKDETDDDDDDDDDEL